MISLLSIKLKDFMNIENLSIEFEKTQTIMIAGNNGSGKSSLLYALALAIVEYRKGDSYKDYVRIGCETASIQLKALYKSEPISFDITIVNNKYDTPLNRKIVYKKETYVNSECAALLKSFDTEYLDQVMFLFQNDSSITDLKPAERAKLLKRLFHLEFEEQVQSLKGRLEQAIDESRSLSVRIEEALKLKFEKVEHKPVLEAVELDELRSQLNSLRDQQILLVGYDASELAEVEKKLREIESSLKDVSASIDRFEEELGTLRGLLSMAPPSKPEYLLEHTPEVLSVELTKLDSSIREASFNLESQNKALTEKTAQLKIHESGVCYVCGQEVDPSSTSKLIAEKDKIADCIKGFEETKSSLSKDRSSLLKKIEEAKLAYGTYLRELKAFEATTNAIAAVPSRIAELESSLATMITSKGLLEGTLSQLRDRETHLHGLKEVYKKKEALAKAIGELEVSIKNNDLSKVYNDYADERNEQIENLETDHKKYLANLGTQQHNTLLSIETLRSATAIFESSFPNFLILRTCGRIEESINAFVSKIFPYMKVKLSQSRGGVEFLYTTSDSDAWLSVKMASGAQASILALAWRVAIANLYGLSTLLFDEVDSAATDENSKLIYEFLSSLSSFNQLLIISHRKEALRAVSNLSDNVACYWVDGGEYELVDPENLN